MQLLNKRKLLDQPFHVVLNILKHNDITSACSEMNVTKVSGIEAFLSLAIKLSWYTHSFFLQTVLVKYICSTFTSSLVFFFSNQKPNVTYKLMFPFKDVCWSKVEEYHFISVRIVCFMYCVSKVNFYTIQVESWWMFKHITHMCTLQIVLSRTGVEGYRWQIRTAILSVQGRSWT